MDDNQNKELSVQSKLNRYLQKAEGVYKKSNQITHGWVAVFFRAWKRFGFNRGKEVAAGIAFFSIFSIIPLIVFVISSVSPFISRSVILDVVRNFLATAFPVSMEGLMDIIGSVMASRTSSKLIFIIGLLWAASNMFNFVFSGINHAWNPKRTRGFIRGRLLALFAVTAVAILAVVLLIISFFIRLIAGLYPWLGNQLFTIGLPLLTQTFLIYLLYKYGPDTVVERKSGVISAILVTIAIDITTRGFTWYLNSDLSSYTTLYGSLGAIIGLLFWVYLSDWILLFGAYLTEAIQKRSNSGDPNQFIEPWLVTVTSD